MVLMDFETSLYLEQVSDMDPPKYKAIISKTPKRILKAIIGFDKDCLFAHGEHSVINHEEVKKALKDNK